MANIKVSVVVPVYNVKGYVEKCIESIIGQSYTNIEIILIDDGSTDGSSDICDYYAKKDNRIRVIHKANGGLVSARKAGTAAATGDYILNVDGDDWIENNRIEVLITNGIMVARADMIYLSGFKRDFDGDSVFINEDISSGTFYDDDIEKQMFSQLFDDRKAFKKPIKSLLVLWAVRSDLLKKQQALIDERIVIGEDAICIWFCLLEAKSITLTKQGGYHYVQRKSAITYSAADNKNTLPIKIWYCQLSTYIKKINFSQLIYQKFIFQVLFEIINSNYRLLLKNTKEYLYPFPKVKHGHRIIVYGAGRCGYSLMRYLSETDDYKIKLWVDKNLNRPVVPGWVISPVEDIVKVDYDYIVIAVLDADIADEIKVSLMYKGIPEQKIATMDASVITEDAIPEEIAQ